MRETVAARHGPGRPAAAISADDSWAKLRGADAEIRCMSTSKRAAAATLLAGVALALSALGCEPADQAPSSPHPGAPTPVSPPPDIGPDGTFVPPETSPELPSP
jgi:hypothetical protein